MRIAGVFCCAAWLCGVAEGQTAGLSPGAKFRPGMVNLGRPAISQRLHEEFWLTSRRMAYSAVEEIVVTLHVRNVGVAPTPVMCGSEQFKVRLEDEQGREVRRAQPPRVVGTMAFPKVLQQGKESGDCVRVEVDDRMHAESALPGEGEYVVDVSPAGDPAVHVRLRFGYAAR